MLERGAECEDGSTQLAAVTQVPDRASHAVVASGPLRCIAERGADSVDVEKREKLVLPRA